jgi:outer membrane protein OmpA-like peptidoglycan-associated protein
MVIFLAGLLPCTQAQILDKVKKKTEEKVKKEAEKKVNEGVDKLFGKDKNKKDTSKTAPKNKTVKENKVNQPVVTGTDKDMQLLTSSKFDFIPGEKVLLFDDFTSENVGDFPVLWNTTGSGEIITTNLFDGRWFKITNARGITTLEEPLNLPENYTIEFDVIPQKDNKNNSNTDFSFYIISTSKPKVLNYGLARPGDAAIKFSFQYTDSYLAYYNDKSPDLSGRENQPRLLADKKYHISVWVQKERVRLYVGQEKLFDVPKAMSKKYKYNMIRFDGGVPMIGNFRIAAGIPDLRNKLLTEGKLVSYGIYFDVNKDIVKSESFATLKEIAAVLKDNPAVKIKIVGHTDSDGDDNSNMDLSKRRAASVKNSLVKVFNIDASRIETDGKGESEPVAANDNSTNKALNRRVEFIKM